MLSFQLFDPGCSHYGFSGLPFYSQDRLKTGLSDAIDWLMIGTLYPYPL